MNKLTDKLIILVISLIIYIPNANNTYLVVPILISVILSAILSYLENDHAAIAVFITFIAVCFLVPDFIYFIPLICCDIMHIKSKSIWLLSFLPLPAFVQQPLTLSKWLVAALIAAVYILEYRTAAYLALLKEYNKLRDNSIEISMKLEKQNKDILEKQDYEINLATISERNRIARDIHDNVGHMLSRSILQIGAMLAVNKSEETKESLRQIKETLSEAMDSIRSSVHDLHEESIDLKTEIQKLIEGFSFCQIRFDYDIDTNLKKNVKYCFIAVTKEALSNIIKHSDASEASVIIREHPALYQLVIQDNGTNTGCNTENGIGLKNISDRVAAVGGNINISTGNGFRIFISVPK